MDIQDSTITLTKKLWSVTKPGIVMGNAITVAGGFFLAIGHYKQLLSINVVGLFLLVLCGISLIIASGCVFNNYIDRDIDILMERTRNRVIARGLLTHQVALVYAFILAFLGLGILYFASNVLAVTLAVIGLIVYIFIYTLWLKRTSVYATIVGSVAGAMPPVVGYCAVTNIFDSGALILFLLLCIWQVPHSYAIAIYRLNDYRKINIPVLPIKYSINIAKYHIVIFSIAFLVVSLLLFAYGYVGYYYLITAMLVGLYWVYVCTCGFSAEDSYKWAFRVFKTSIIVLTVLAIVMAINTH